MTTQPASSATCFRLEPADFGASESQWNDWGWQYANRIRRPEDLEGIRWRGMEEIGRKLIRKNRHGFILSLN